MAIISNNTKMGLQQIVDYCFNANSILDNCVYGLEYDINLPLFADWIHQNIAHKTPQWADLFQEFALKRGVRITRGAIEAHNKSYRSPIDCLQDIYNCFDAFENLIYKVIEMAIENKDKAEETFMSDFVANVLPNYKFQASQFIEGLKAYDDDNIVADFNDDFESFVITDLKN